MVKALPDVLRATICRDNHQNRGVSIHQARLSHPMSQPRRLRLHTGVAGWRASRLDSLRRKRAGQDPIIKAQTHLLTIATIATESPMGAQAYQESIATRAAGALAATSADQWTVDRSVVRSLRSALEGNRRLPMSVVARASPLIRRQLGRMLYSVVR